MIVTWAVLMFGLGALVPVTRADWNLVLAHSNDILSHLDQITDDYAQCTVQQQGQCYGGVARHRFKALDLKRTAESAGDVFLHLNAGSMLGGSVWFPVLGVEPMANSTSYLGYNAVGLGYRDFDEGIPSASQYLSRLKSLGVDVVCANADFSKEPSFKDLVKRSVVIKPKNDIVVGIIGFLGTDADYLADTGEIQFDDEVSAIKSEIERLKKDHKANFFIALGSAGYNKGKEILEKVPELNILVNGGSNTFLYNGNPGSSADTVVGTYPFVTDSNWNKRVLVQVPRYGKYLGCLKVKVSGEGKIGDIDSESNPFLLRDDQDEELKSFVSDWSAVVVNQSSTVIGKTLVPLVSARETCWHEECNAAALITDAALWFFNSNISAAGWKDAVAAVVWHGGALARTNLTIAPGDVTFGHILAMFPFANTLSHMKLKGATVRKLFETSVEFMGDPAAKASGEFLHVAGARVEYDLSQPKGSRVTRILMRNPSAAIADLLPLDEDATYKIGMPSFIARGGSRYSFLKEFPHEDTQVRDEDVLRDYISFVKVLTIGTEDRIAFIEPQICWVDQTGTVFLTIFLTLLFSAVVYWIVVYGVPKLRQRSGSLTNLVR